VVEVAFRLNGVRVEDTFAEAFRLWVSRLIITAKNARWARIAAQTMTGFATSIIMCGCEAGIECELSPDETPDGRPGVSVLVFTGRKDMEDQLLRRVGQCVLTSPTSAVYNGIPLEEAEDTVSLGGRLRFFGDGYQKKVRLGDGLGAKRRLWRIPVMEGEFLIEDKFGMKRGVAGGNFIILGRDVDSALEASERAVKAIESVKGVITPFPGGVCRSGSKVGSRYKFLRASTNTPLCPTLRAEVPDTQVPEGVGSVFEIVINGVDLDSVKRAMAVGIREAVKVDGVLGITAGNYGGRLGKYLIYLKECLGV